MFLGKSGDSRSQALTRPADQTVEQHNELADWFQTTLGIEVISEARKWVSRLVPPGYYRTGFQVGPCRDGFLQNAEHACFGVAPQDPFHDEAGRRQVECLAEQLPFGARSIDLLVLPFTLEFSADPHTVLREANVCWLPRDALWSVDSTAGACGGSGVQCRSARGGAPGPGISYR